MIAKPELCPACHGKGSYTRKKLFDHHKGDYEETIYSCSTCKGSGRVLRIVTPDKFVPYQTEEPTK